ncbi:KdsC family phosphatase [Neisseria chenwenguii]|uniref:3-deoxy-D-manno-octulosonate 8-phosphate phosphatase KdsC n=1 Tax=Neisseria chenwenguii TaxID=1853278 RepID=A0A220S200_9NEIS|nr:HAD family hydrolase [Neisseria chenwenguii]ASK27467.1 phenylphosphate carboxylase subunit delta [Neisseria chenwenguii]ROV56901.1 HAD family hydrolase [Neisseria chenwenguii]
MNPLPPEIQARAAKIKLLVLDVDGVLTDGRIYIRDTGEEIKAFHTLDGHGLKMLQASGVQTAIITGRDAPSVGLRVKQLGINHYFKGIHDKRAAYAELRAAAGVEEDECAFVGDDVVDLPVMVRCGLPVAVPQAHWFARQHAVYVTSRDAGKGAVREVCDLIMQAQGTLEPALNRYIA